MTNLVMIFLQTLIVELLISIEIDILLWIIIFNVNCVILLSLQYQSYYIFYRLPFKFINVNIQFN